MQSFISRHARCRVRYHGLPGSNVPLLFIHGLGCASSFEYPYIYADPAFGSRCSVLIDLPGSGYSEKPDAFDYTTSDQAAVVAELVEHLGLHRFFLYGHYSSVNNPYLMQILMPFRGREFRQWLSQMPGIPCPGKTRQGLPERWLISVGIIKATSVK